MLIDHRCDMSMRKLARNGDDQAQGALERGSARGSVRTGTERELETGAQDWKPLGAISTRVLKRPVLTAGLVGAHGLEPWTR
jgi:hypothetical protein